MELEEEEVEDERGEVVVMAIDCEWGPTSGGLNRPALMQLAARDRAWVVDCNSWRCGGGGLVGVAGEGGGAAGEGKGATDEGTGGGATAGEGATGEGTGDGLMVEAATTATAAGAARSTAVAGNTSGTYEEALANRDGRYDRALAELVLYMLETREIRVIGFAFSHDAEKLEVREIGSQRSQAS